MPVAGTKNLIYNITVIGQKNQSFGILIESAYWKDALWKIDIADDIAFHVCFTGSSDSDRLIKSDVDKFFLLRRFQDAAINDNFISGFVATSCSSNALLDFLDTLAAAAREDAAERSLEVLREDFAFIANGGWDGPIMAR